jgi:hypothetical protein
MRLQNIIPLIKSALFSREGDSVEEVYHSLLLAELNQDTSREYYALLPEQYTGDGRADILLVDKKNKILIPIELKCATTKTTTNLKKSAQVAVQQAIDRKYGDDDKYKGYKKQPAIGIGFWGTDVALSVSGEDDIIIRRTD